MHIDIPNIEHILFSVQPVKIEVVYR